MKKEQKEKIKKTIIEHFMPADKPIDYETETAGCIACTVSCFSKSSFSS